MTRTQLHRRLWSDEACGTLRRGSFMTLGLFCLVVGMTFVAFSVDVGMISLTQTRMQNACDTAALAAAMEITYAIENADADVDNVYVIKANGRVETARTGFSEVRQGDVIVVPPRELASVTP